MIHRWGAARARAKLLEAERDQLKERITMLESAIEKVRLETDWCPLCDGHHTGECK